MNNIYIPSIATIDKITDETPDVRTLKLLMPGQFDYMPGQFVELSVFGSGEATFCIASSPTREGFIECSIKKFGKVTQAVHDLNEGDTVGIRGPYGNTFPVDDMKGKDLIFVGGGIGLAPLRSLIEYCLDTRDNYKDINIIYGSRSVADLVYKDELKEWQARSDVNTVLTVDPGGETREWKGKVGLIPAILEEVNPPAENSLLITCGPPIMIKFVLKSADKLGFKPEQIITTLERKMQCGFGQCGHCMMGQVYVCKDGPVFTYKQIQDLYEEI